MKKRLFLVLVIGGLVLQMSAQNNVVYLENQMDVYVYKQKGLWGTNWLLFHW